MAYSTMDGRRIYGEFYAYGSFGPSVVSRKFYFENKGVLTEADITHGWLTSVAPGPFPRIDFKTTEIGKLDFNVIVDIAAGLGIKYIQSRSVTAEEKKALNRAIIHHIEKLQGV